MINPNDNLKRLLLALHALSQNRRAVAAVQASVATDTLLTLFLFGQDYFGWWRCPFPATADSALVLTMISLSLAICGFFALLASIYLTFRFGSIRASARTAQSVSRAFRAMFLPTLYGLPVLWGHAYLTDGNTGLWGSLSVAYAMFYQVGLFTLLTAEKVVEPRRERDESSERLVRSRARLLFWLRFWRLTRPAYVRRMRPLDRSLYVATVRGDAPWVAACLRRGADPNLRMRFDTPLLVFAAGRGYAEVVRVLLAQGASVNARSNSGVTALMVVASQGHGEAVQTLLEAGADPSVKDAKGVTALEYARRKGHSAVAAMLESKSPGP